MPRDEWPRWWDWLRVQGLAAGKRQALAGHGIRLAAVPVALLAAVVMMMLGYVVGGLALFGGSVLAAAIAVALAA
jgi:hypothetical protein